MSNRKAKRGFLKDYQSVTIHGWMSNKLGLSGNKLLVYATIFQYSSMGNTEFSGGLEVLSNLCDITTDSIYSILDQLLQDRLISVAETHVNGRMLKLYKVNLRKVYAAINFKEDK